MSLLECAPNRVYGLKMELLYRTVLPRTEVHCMCWSPLNIVALSVSGEVEGYVSESYDV